MLYSVRNCVAFFIANGFIISGLLKKRIAELLQQQVILSLYTHNPNKRYFEKYIRWLHEKGFKFISMSDLLKIASGEISFPYGAVIITVDDGWKENKLNVVTISRKYNIPITIFVSTDPVLSGNPYWWSCIEIANRLGLIDHTVADLKKMSNDQRLQIVREVQSVIKQNREAFTVDELLKVSKNKLVTIGSHTVNHPILTNCTDQQSLIEICDSKKILSNLLEKNIDTFSYPNGDFSDREINYLKHSGYKLGFTTINNCITPDNIHESFTLPRTDLVETISFAENVCRITGVWFIQKQQFKKIIKKQKNDNKLFHG